jgi:hypothetical protein
MVMQRSGRLLTVEEARGLPPLTAREVERRKRVIEEIRVLAADILAERGGIPISEDELDWATGRGRYEGDEEEPFGEPDPTR